LFRASARPALLGDDHLGEQILSLFASNINGLGCNWEIFDLALAILLG
jgi:hypothetical protein